MADVEHHWHEPTQGQVTKAMYQYLHDQGVTAEALNKMVEQKITSILAGKVDAWVNSGRFDQLLLAAVSDWVSGEKKSFEQNRYGYVNRIRDLARAELQRLVLDEYEVKVTPRAKP